MKIILFIISTSFFFNRNAYHSGNSLGSSNYTS